MSLSKALLGWKGNLTTFIPADYVLLLRMDVNAFSDAAKELELENDDLRAENEKLCDLVKDMLRCMDYQDTPAYAHEHCTDCPYYKSDCGYLMFGLRAAELGIEADG